MSIFSALTSALTAPGTSNALNKNRVNNRYINFTNEILKQFGDRYIQNADYLSSMLPFQQGALTSLASLFDPRQQGMAAETTRRRATAAGQRNARLLANMYGPNSAAAKSALIDATNRGTSAGNQQLASFYDPQARAQALAALLGAFQNANQNPFGVVGQAANMLHQTPTPFVGPQPLDQIEQGLGVLNGLPTVYHNLARFSAPKGTPAGLSGLVRHRRRQ